MKIENIFLRRIQTVVKICLLLLLPHGASGLILKDEPNLYFRTPCFTCNFFMPLICYCWCGFCEWWQWNIYCVVEYWCKVQPKKSTVETRRELLELSNYCDKTTLVTLPIFASTSTAGHQHCKTRLWHFLLSLSDWSFEIFRLWTEPQIPFFMKIQLSIFDEFCPPPVVIDPELKT